MALQFGDLLKTSHVVWHRSTPDSESADSSVGSYDQTHMSHRPTLHHRVPRKQMSVVCLQLDEEDCDHIYTEQKGIQLKMKSNEIIRWLSHTFWGGKRILHLGVLSERHWLRIRMFSSSGVKLQPSILQESGKFPKDNVWLKKISHAEPGFYTNTVSDGKYLAKKVEIYIKYFQYL